MNIQLSQSDICLSKRQMLSLANGAGVRIEARSGAVWVTQDHDRRDIVLRPGESFTLDGRGQAIVQAFEASRVRLTQAGAVSAKVRHPGWAERLRNAFERAPARALALARALARPAVA